ncbi:ubiquitin-protein ligase E3C isoform X2 [Anthonomus grandis grandis]|uniref:ubiquitin-protein ligase E3C isoform X2 n=1 Tax=Anthonomus grandis grandis TaxID=2921223 RepID=UPI002166069B|nr:ubiquitin-protein ligase E3C isoform X2 [Anthonomus grandis grandis]
MAFKLSYSFEGNTKTRPEQNLSGASRKLTRDDLIQKTQEERRKRQEQRLKLQSAELLQSHIRSYLVRKHVKEEQRQQYSRIESSISVSDKLKKLLFFYDPSLDFDKLLKLSKNVLSQVKEIHHKVNTDSQSAWALKRFLVLCMKHFNCANVDVMLKVVNVFTDKADIVFYLLRKGYYRFLRNLLDNSPKERLPEVTALIHKPLKFLSDFGPSQDTVLSEFCDNFLRPKITHNIKYYLIPYLKGKSDSLYYDKLIRYLSSSYYITASNSLFYCMLALEPTDYEPTYDTIHILSLLSKDLHTLRPGLDLTDDDDYDEDDDIEMTDEKVLLSDYLNIMNGSNKVKKWLNFFEANSDDQSVLKCFVNFAQNLLLVYKDSIRKFLLLYKLGLNSIFLKKLWSTISKSQPADLQINGASLLSWKDCHTNLSVFCDMFTFYTETLTDKENSDTSETFTPNDLHSMSSLLKGVALDLIEVAFPMCRASSISATPEISHLYQSYLDCLKMLYTLDMRKQFCPPGFWTARKMHVSHDLAKKNYLSKRSFPFGSHPPFIDDDEHLPPLSTIEQRSLAILQELPFLIPFNTRVQLLRDLCRYSLGENDYQRMHHERMFDNTVVIRRNYLYEDAFEKISTKSETDLKHRVRIQFINNIGLEEAGIDGGGIFKEFINEVLKTAFDPNRGFFLMTADNTLYPNPNVHLIVENFAEHYHFIGKLVGKAIFENILVDLPIAEFFLAKLLVDRASACYLKSLDPVLYRNLLYLRDYNGDVSDLGLDFTTVNNDLGETRELNPQFCIQSSGVEHRMPTASTCINLLKLPIIYEEEVLRSKLVSAIEIQAGFELS